MHLKMQPGALCNRSCRIRETPDACAGLAFHMHFNTLQSDLETHVSEEIMIEMNIN
jgi:hypothetical protein